MFSSHVRTLHGMTLVLRPGVCVCVEGGECDGGGESVMVGVCVCVCVWREVSVCGGTTLVLRPGTQRKEHRER